MKVIRRVGRRESKSKTEKNGSAFPNWIGKRFVPAPLLKLVLIMKQNPSPAGLLFSFDPFAFLEQHVCLACLSL